MGVLLSPVGGPHTQLHHFLRRFGKVKGHFRAYHVQGAMRPGLYRREGAGCWKVEKRNCSS